MDLKDDRYFDWLAQLAQSPEGVQRCDAIAESYFDSDKKRVVIDDIRSRVLNVIDVPDEDSEEFIGKDSPWISNPRVDCVLRTQGPPRGKHHVTSAR